MREGCVRSTPPSLCAMEDHHDLHRPDAFRVAIVGGGTAGLASALALQEKIDALQNRAQAKQIAHPPKSLHLTILESGPRVGGNNQSFDGVPLFFSCIRCASGADALRRRLKQFSLRATPCDFLSVAMKDSSGGSSAGPSARRMSAEESSTTGSDTATTMSMGSSSTGEDGGSSRCGDDSLDDDGSSASDAVVPLDSIGDDVSSSSLSTPRTATTTTATTATTATCAATSANVQQLAGQASSRAYLVRLARKESRPAETEEPSVSFSGHSVLSVSGEENTECSEEDSLTSRSLKKSIVDAVEYGAPASSLARLSCYFQEKLKLSRCRWTQTLFCNGVCPDGRFSKKSRTEPYRLAAGMNYFYGSSTGFDKSCMETYCRHNPGTYYYSVENGRNDLIIEKMVERLMGGVSERGGAEGVNKRSSDVARRFRAAGDSSSAVSVRCEACCELVRPMQDGRVMVQWSERGQTSSAESPPSHSQVFDAVLVCLPPHVARRIVDCPQAKQLCADFCPVKAHSIVHTDYSVKSKKYAAAALTYETARSGDWTLHIDCDRFYRMTGNNRTGNIVSVYYEPDTGPDIDPKLVKGEFTATLSKVSVPRKDPAQESSEEGSTVLLTNADLRENVRRYHAEGGSVFFSSSYWSCEQWTQDAFSIAEEVAGCVAKRLVEARAPAASEPERTASKMRKNDGSLVDLPRVQRLFGLRK